MSTGFLSPVGLILQVFSDQGIVGSGFKINTYVGGSVSTPLTTYTDSTLTVANANPLVLSSAGRLTTSVWVPAGTLMKIVLTDASNNVIPNGTIDNIPAFNDFGTALFPRNQSEINAGVTPTNYGYQWGDVRRYGAVGDGSTDDTTAFQNALSANSGQTVYVPVPSVYYKISTGLTIPTNTTVQGSNKRLAKIQPSGNIDLFTLNDGACLYELYLEGNATTGRGILIPSGLGNQTVQNCRIINFAPGASKGCVDYADTTAGSRSIFIDCEVWQTGGATGSGNYAFRTPDASQLSAVPKTFIGIQTSGFCSFYFGGANDNFIAASFLADCAYTANTRAVMMVNCRIANQVALTVDGHNNSIVACDLNPTITINASADNCSIGPGSFNNLPITDNSANARNNITHWRTSYTPALSGWTLGNGTLTGSYERQCATITFTVNYTVGSTDTVSGALSISLPIARVNSDIMEFGNMVGNRGGTLYTAVGQAAGAVSVFTLIRDTSGAISAASPAAWAAGDTIRFTGTYSL
jgi:hypothetical protein